MVRQKMKSPGLLRNEYRKKGFEKEGDTDFSLGHRLEYLIDI